MVADGDLPGINRIAHCSSEASIGFTLKYNPSSPLSEDDEVSHYHRSQQHTALSTIVIQVAMSYSTLAERDITNDEIEEAEEKEVEERRHRRIARNEHNILHKKNQKKSRKKKVVHCHQKEDVNGEDGADFEDCDDDDDDDDDEADDEESMHGGETEDSSSEEESNSFDTSLTTVHSPRENIEHEYNTQICINLALDEEHRQVQKSKKKRDKSLLETLGNRVTQSQFRREQTTCS